MSQRKGIADRPRAIRGARIFFSAWLLAAACGAPPTAAVALEPELGSIQEVLVREYRADVRPFPDRVEAVELLADRDVLVFVASEPTVPVLAVDEPTKIALREYLQNGGAMLLLGYATRIAYELGVESTPPDRFEPFRWGLDQRTRLGDYRFGMRVVSGRVPELVHELWEEPRGHVYLLGGGELADVQSCHWEGYSPRDGEVLAQLSRTRDGEPADLDSVVLTRWTAGLGTVLAYGSLPEPWRADREIASNAAQFLRNALRVVHGAKPTSVALCVSQPKPERRPDPELPPWMEREVPGQVLASHWGWQVALNYLHGDQEPQSPAQIVERVMLPSWRAGADLLDLQLPDLHQGYPLAWRGNDRLARPQSYWGGRIWPEWSAEALHEMALEAHARAMLLQTWLAPAPVKSDNRVDRLAAMRWLGRELLDLRVWGGGALDGFGVAGWFRDPRGFTVGAVQEYHPGTYLYDTGGGTVAGSAAVLDANRGRPLGLNAAGVSTVWRNQVLDLDFPAAMLDARSRRPSPRLWGDHAVGGGSYGDWIVTQANDFVRGRLHRAPALWWQSFNPATMDDRTLAYVQGVSMDPIKAAVAGRLSATGVGGYRDLLAGSVPNLQSGFGAESQADAASHFLQNNHLRLHGSRGALLVDPGGLARFRLGEETTTRVLAREFMHTRMFGGKPSPVELRTREIDLLGGRRRGESGYGEVVTIRGTERGAGRFPELLAQDETPRWPRRVDLHFHPELGLYELQLELRGETGRGVLEMRRDGELVKLFDFRARQRDRHVMPFPIARSGDRQISLEVVDGGSVAVETLRLVRVADVAAEGLAAELAGHRASLEEWTASSYHADRARITTLADLPGFLMSVDYDRVSRSMKIERRFGFLHHRQLRASTDGEGPERLRGPFILASGRREIPDLAVIPIGMARYDHFVLSPEGLVLVSQPRAYESLEIGFMLLEDAAALEHLPAVFAELRSPPRLELNATGPALVTSDLPIGWVRAIRVHNPWGTPYMVRENGWWVHRGAQPARGGGDWLRLYQRPGDEVQILAGPELLASTRPGPGSLHNLALRDVGPGRVTARVMQVDSLGKAPAVSMADPFDEVTIDGRAWSYFDGTTVYLPLRTGDYQIETRSHGSGPAPHLVRTRADVLESSYDPERRILTIRTAASDDRPSELPYTALIAGPIPTGFDGCSRVPESELSYRDDVAEYLATSRGIIVRFRPGTMRLQFGGGATANSR